MKQIILSFDYELFFGDSSGTIEKSLLIPTELLLDRMKKNGQKANFFIDFLMLKYLKMNSDERSKKDLKLLTNQILRILKEGHRIEMHLHPHWIDAKYNGDGTWNFDNFIHYSLNSLSIPEVVELFKEGKLMLEEIAHEFDPDYRIMAFRAGGWSIQPFRHIKEGFKQTGLIIDSSLSAGQKCHNMHSYYDFTHMPSKSIYHFEDEVEVEKETGQFVEIPITSYRRLFIQKIYDKIMWRFSSKMKKIADGTNCRSSEPFKTNYKFYNSCMLTTRAPYLSVMLQCLFIKKSLLVFIDHPKDFLPNTLKVLDFLAKYGETKFYIDYI